jgi:hypothetical protein
VVGVAVVLAVYLLIGPTGGGAASTAPDKASPLRGDDDILAGPDYSTRYAELAASGAERTASDGSVRRGPAVPGKDVPFEIKKGYFDKEKGRILNPNDCDGDGLPDDWEMKTFGDLLQNRKTWVAAKERLDAARRPAGPDDPKDTDADTLDDEWERKNFGDLSQGPNDDPDADGYYNYVEMTSQQREQSQFDPNRPNLADVKYRPKTLPPARSGEIPATSRLPWSIRSREFWLKQDALRYGETSPATEPDAASVSNTDTPSTAADAQ